MTSRLIELYYIHRKQSVQFSWALEIPQVKQVKEFPGSQSRVIASGRNSTSSSTLHINSIFSPRGDTICHFMVPCAIVPCTFLWLSVNSSRYSFKTKASGQGLCISCAEIYMMGYILYYSRPRSQGARRGFDQGTPDGFTTKCVLRWNIDSNLVPTGDAKCWTIVSVAQFYLVCWSHTLGELCEDLAMGGSWEVYRRIWKFPVHQREGTQGPGILTRSSPSSWIPTVLANHTRDIDFRCTAALGYCTQGDTI